MKTVYFLGAGFAKDAGVPLQSGILPYLFDPKNQHYFNKSDLKTFKNFLTKTYQLNSELISKITLEDVFTPIDRCISEDIPLRNIPPNDLKDIRQCIYRLIGQVVKTTLERDNSVDSQSDYLDVFANNVINLAKSRTEGHVRGQDKVSIISTNWDITIDGRLYRLARTEPKLRNELPGAVVDYCCHISSFEEHDHTVKPGLEVLGAGGYNVKLLKLHGSLNWVKCSRCQRTYVDFSEKIAIHHELRSKRCRHCLSNFQEEANQISLVSDMIMPTFIKDLSSTQYKMIWQNAGIELSEASKIVFIGYSLPPADFEIRQLIRRMVRHDAEIICVTGGKNPKPTFDNYQNFFGRKITTYSKGAREYVLNTMKD